MGWGRGVRQARWIGERPLVLSCCVRMWREQSTSWLIIRFRLTVKKVRGGGGGGRGEKRCSCQGAGGRKKGLLVTF